MDLIHDWKVLNDVLYLNQEKPSKNISFFENSNSENIISGLEQTVPDAALLGTNYFQQLKFIQERLLKDYEHGFPIKNHFILYFFTKFRKFLPNKFNVLVFIDEREPSIPSNIPKYRSILLNYVSGKLDQFFEPDFSSLSENRLSDWKTERKEIAQYLESRYMLPCYAVFMWRQDWLACVSVAESLEKRKPWRLFAKYYEEGRVVIYPENLTTKALLATQRILVYFGRS